MITIWSSQGEYEIDENTGKIDPTSQRDYGGRYIIESFDVKEWVKYYNKPLDSDIDILDIGYWCCTRDRNTKTGFSETQYKPAVVEYREELKTLYVY